MVKPPNLQETFGVQRSLLGSLVSRTRKQWTRGMARKLQDTRTAKIGEFAVHRGSFGFIYFLPFLSISHHHLFLEASKYRPSGKLPTLTPLPPPSAAINCRSVTLRVDAVARHQFIGSDEMDMRWHAMTCDDMRWMKSWWNPPAKQGAKDCYLNLPWKQTSRSTTDRRPFLDWSMCCRAHWRASPLGLRQAMPKVHFSICAQDALTKSKMWSLSLHFSIGHNFMLLLCPVTIYSATNIHHHKVDISEPFSF